MTIREIKIAVGGAVVIAALLGWGWYNSSEADARMQDYLKREGTIQELKRELVNRQKREDGLEREIASAKEDLRKAEAGWTGQAPVPLPPVDPPRDRTELSKDFVKRWSLENTVTPDGLVFTDASCFKIHHQLQLADTVDDLTESVEGAVASYTAAKRVIAGQDQLIADLKLDKETAARIEAERQAQIADLNAKIKADARANWVSKAKWAGVALVAGFVIAKR